MVPHDPPGPASYSIAVLGVHKYRGELERLCCCRLEDVKTMDVEATLVSEDHNPGEERPIRVEIHGLMVGLLSPHDAREYRERLDQPEGSGVLGTCGARIIGGGDVNRTTGRGRSGCAVLLDLPSRGP